MLDAIDEELKPVIQKYMRKIYALVFYLISNDSDKAYQITASSYVETFMTIRSLDNEEEILVTLVKQAIEQSRKPGIMPSSKEPPFKNVPPERVKMLHILSKALQEMPYDEKVLLLLRDQLHLSNHQIASVLGISQAQVRSQINQVRVQIRKKVEGALL